MAKIYLKKVKVEGNKCSECYFGQTPVCTLREKIKDDDLYLSMNCENIIYIQVPSMDSNDYKRSAE